MEKKKYTAVIILNYNNFNDTINCVESVERFNTALIKYIIIDNGSTNINGIKKLDVYLSGKFQNNYIKIDETTQIHYELPLVTLLISKTNDGYARGNNKGLERVYNDDSIETILILNNDVLFLENIIPSLTKRLKLLPNCGIVSPLLLKSNKKDIDFNCARYNLAYYKIIYQYIFYFFDLLGLKKKWQNEQEILRNHFDYLKKDYFEIELPSGSCMLCNKNVFQKIGSFDSNTFLYYEENILYKKIKDCGLKNYLIPNLKCIHLGASTTSKQNSYFLVKASFDSAVYYVENYTKACKILIVLLKFFRFIFLNVFKIKNRIL